MPNGVDCSYFTPSKNGMKPHSLVFTGSMDWEPNNDAIFYFIKHIYPLIKKKVQEISFTIVGRDPSDALIKLASKDKSIELTGRVDDVRPYIANSCLYIVPLRIGGGTRLKILEAMAMGKTVISTSIGAEGLEVTSEENIILADEPQVFAKRALELFENNNLRKNIESSGRKLTEQKYSWDIIADKLGETWEAVGIKK